MAYALSHLHSLVRGSVGGLTYFANQFHQICIRQRTAPVQPNTPYQSGIRSAFDYAESQFAALSPLDRQLWDDYAVTCIYPGPAGPYSVPGRQLAVGSIALAAYADAIAPGTFQVQSLAPVVSGWFNVGTILVEEYVGLEQGIAVSVGVDAGRAAVAVVDVSIAHNLTRNRYKGPWLSASKAIQACPAGARSIIEIDRPLGSLGKAIFTRTRVFSADPVASPVVAHALAFPVYLRHICQEAPPPAPPAATKKKAKNE